MPISLYLDAVLTDKTLLFSAVSAVALFALKFCSIESVELSGFKVFLVLSGSKDVTAKKSTHVGIIHVPQELLSNCLMIEPTKVPEHVARCQLPVLTTINGLMVHSGLCSVLRALIYELDNLQPHLKLSQLLGFRGMCLKACAEVSVWTKFCEIQIPELVTKIAKQHYSSPMNFNLDEEIVHFEEHFAQPAVIPNLNKRKQKIEQQLRIAKSDVTEEEFKITDITVCEELYRESSIHDLQLSKQSHNSSRRLTCDAIDADMILNNLTLRRDLYIPSLEHIYAEGADFTLTDLILFPCISCILSYYSVDRCLLEKIPKICAWYNRLKAVGRIQSAIKCTNLPVVTVKWPLIPTLGSAFQSSTKKDNKLVKKKVKVNTADAVPLINKLEVAGIELKQDCHVCATPTLDWSTLPASVHPLHGSLPDDRIVRKCQQLQNLALAVKSISTAGDVIVDFCAGGGHLGLVIAALLPECEVLLVENKQESIKRAIDRIRLAGLNNVTLYQCNLKYFTAKISIGTCLHACGVATDLVLKKCVEGGASFVVCPCCYGALQQTVNLHYPRSKLYTNLGFSYQDYLLLARAADDQHTGKQFMTAVDTDRISEAKEMGYDVTLCSLLPLTCSPKNNMLVGVNANTVISGIYYKPSKI